MSKNVLRKLIREVIENNSQTFVAYHSTNSTISDFSHSSTDLKPGSSTRIDAIFFSDIPQKSWGRNVYKVEITSKTPVFYDMSLSRFDSLSVQEAFDALLRQDTSYIKEDLVENFEMGEETAEALTEHWSKFLDLVVLKNTNYAKHSVEYIVPDRYYNGHSAEIKILKN